MKRVVSIATYLESYNISRDEFDRVVAENKDFYDDYIQWGSRKDGSDSVISPKALDRLGETFNSTTQQTAQPDEKPKRKRRTKAEMEEVNNERQIDMSEFMEKPEETKEEIKEPKKKAERTEIKTRKKKSKMNITRAFIQEHGHYGSSDSIDTKNLRKFVIGSGLYKIEQVAMMSDEEILNAVKKDYYFISSPEGTYIIKRSALTSIMSDVYVIED